MSEQIRETFVYEGLGFPVVLVNVPMRKAFGELIIDINFAQLQKVAMLELAKKPTPLSGKEIRFFRHYLNMSTHEFAKELGVSHVSILNWENEDAKMNAASEIDMRLYVLNHLKVTDKEFRKTYTQFNHRNLATRRRAVRAPLEIRAEKIAC